MAKVLVLDDETNVRRLIGNLLSQEGYEVVLAEHGSKGLELYRREHPDVILLDLGMPGISGITVLEHIRKVDMEQPVIIFSGDTTPETEQQVRALGVSELIVKGSSLDGLRDTLKRLLASPSHSA